MKKRAICRFFLSGIILIFSFYGCGLSGDTDEMSATPFESGLRTNCQLESLEFSTPVKLSQDFEPTHLDYSTYVYRSVPEIALTPRSVDRFATIAVNDAAVKSGDPSDLLQLAEDTTTYVNINVTAENGDKNLYRIGIFRSAKSDDTSLLSFTTDVGTMTPTFEESPEGPWELNLPTSQESITVNVVATDNKCPAITIDNTKTEASASEKTILLEPGKTKVIIVKVEAEEDGVVKNYVLKATRAAYEPSTSTELKSITVTPDSGASPVVINPVPAGTDLTTVIPWYCSDVTITAVAADPPEGKGFPAITISGSVPPVNDTIVRGETTTHTIHVLAEDGVTEQNYILNISRDVSTDTSLSSCDVLSDHHTTASWFSVDSDGPWYTLLRYNVGSFRIKAAPQDPMATLTARFQGGADIPLTDGESSDISISTETVRNIELIVTAEDSAVSTTYSARIYRHKYVASLPNANLDDLEVYYNGGGGPEQLLSGFSPGSFTYTTTAVPNEVDSVFILPQENHSGQLISSNGYLNSGPVWPSAGTVAASVPLRPGPNAIKVYSQNVMGSNALEQYTREYTINITRTYTANPNLANLTVDDLSDPFDVDSPSTDTYSVSTETGIREIKITATPEDPNITSITAEITTGRGEAHSIPLEPGKASAVPVDPGDNLIDIIVIADDGATSATYSLSVNTPMSSDNSIKRIQAFTGVSEGTGTQWKIKVGDGVTEVDFIPIPGDSSATIVLKDVDSNIIEPASTGPNRYTPVVSSGNETTFTIEVTAENGDMKVHTLTICPPVTGGGTGTGRLADISITMGDFYDTPRPLYLDFNSPVTDGAASVFSPSEYDYCAVVYGFDMLKVSVTAKEGTGVSSVTVNGAAADITGASPADVFLYSGQGYVTPVQIVVTDGSGGTMSYVVQIKLLNIHEFYRGIYGSAMNITYDTKWEPIKPSGLGADERVDGTVSGQLHWYVDPSKNGCTADSIMNLTDYNDGQMGLPHNNGGLVVVGETLGCFNASKTGYITKGYKIYTPEGDFVADLGYHLYAFKGDKVERDDAYTDCTYMGSTVRMVFYSNDNPKCQSPFDPVYYPDYDYYSSWESP